MDRNTRGYPLVYHGKPPGTALAEEHTEAAQEATQLSRLQGRRR